MIPIPASIAPYLKLIKAGLVLAVLIAIWLHGHHAGYTGEHQKNEAAVSAARAERITRYETDIATAKAAQAKAERDSEAAQARNVASEAAYNALLARIPTSQLVIHDKPTPGQPCPAERLGPDFRLRFNEAVTGSAPVAAPAR